MVVAGWISWLWWNDSISEVDPGDSKPLVFIVNRGDGVKTIAANLYQQNIIRSPTGFYLLVKLLGIERQLQAGDFRLNRSMDATSIARELTHGILDLWVTMLEGWRKEEVATKLAKDIDIPEQEFLKYATEGYMFPDTYLIPRDATPAGVVKMFTDNFDKKVTVQMREDAKKLGFTLDEVMILASLVEKEGKTAEDRPIIAGILEKRLKAGWPLQVDATIQYAIGYQPIEKTWWKKELTADDLKMKSPYNTYLNPGLPPAPICNPGLESIMAVIYPEDSDYWYYLHDLSGVVHYAKTIDEHNANSTKYLQ
jgi:UPF0755 protein